MSLEPANESQAFTARSLIAAVNRPGACEQSQDVMKPPYEPPITPTLDASHSGRSSAASSRASRSSTSTVPKPPITERPCCCP